MSNKVRRISMVIIIIIVCGMWTLLRSIGITGTGKAEFAWRWSKTAEEQLLSKTGKTTFVKFTALEFKETGINWTGFRGENRDGVVHGSKISTDWKTNPPKEVWRKPIGPACSSFAIWGNYLYTQEQRGEYELVSCYSLFTGEPIWQHRDSARFWDSHAGAGPRGTPTLSNGKLYSFGGTGILNVLDAKTGKLIWTHNTAKETNTKTPNWAFASSPLVEDNTVYVSAAGTLVAYNINTGKQLWINRAGGDCYSSPQYSNLCGIQQIILLNETGASGFTPNEGKILWKHEWKGNPILQPTLLTNGDILICSKSMVGIRRLSISKAAEKWNVLERWTSTDLKPNHNDIVVHKGYIYGIEMEYLKCIDLKKGERKWKGERYGGQILLLADQDLLLIVSEKGELALVEAKPDKFNELTRFKAIEGKTWNHPVLIGDLMIVRNTQEMAAFRLPVVKSL